MDVVIDGSAVQAERDVHRALARQLEFGDSYGWNLAALRDRLSTDVPRPVHLVWTDAEISRARLGDENFERIVRVFTDVAAQDEGFGWEDRFTFELA